MHFILSTLAILTMFAAGFVIGAYMDHRMYQNILQDAKKGKKPLTLEGLY